MKHAFLLALALCVLCGGCIRSISYVHHPDGRIEARYTNMGFDTSIDGLTIRKTADSTDVQVSKYNSQTQAWQVAGQALELANKVAK